MALSERDLDQGMLTLMFASLRIKSSIIMFLIWLSVPASYMCVSSNFDANRFFTVLPIASLVVFILDIGIYMGNAEALAGFNTISPEELEQHDMDKVPVFSGLGRFLLSLVMFHGSVLVSLSIGKLEGVLFTMASSVAIMAVSSFFIACGKRFRAVDG